MTMVTRKIWVDAPKEKVWEVLADFGGVCNYNPAVSHSFSTSEANWGVGATRHCELTTAGTSIEERVIDWKEGESYTVEVFEGKATPPYKYFYGTIQVKEEAGGTTVSGILEYEIRYGFMGDMMNLFLLKAQFTRNWEKLFAGLKLYVETGEEVSDKTSVNVNQVAVVS